VHNVLRCPVDDTATGNNEEEVDDDDDDDDGVSDKLATTTVDQHKHEHTNLFPTTLQP